MGQFDMKRTRISSNLHILHGGVNTGVLLSGRCALLIDCCDMVTPDVLATIGVDTVVVIACTQHRRPHTAGVAPYMAAGARLIAPAAERHWFEDVTAYWQDPQNRWHTYHQQPGPMLNGESMSATRYVSEGDMIEWAGLTIHVLDTPGATDGSVSYLLQVDGQTVCFSGDAIYGPGQIWDLYSLQKGRGTVRDYHSFMGNRRALLPSLQKLAACGAKQLIPAHGAPIDDPIEAIALLLERLDTAWRNYTAISALNHYFPNLFRDTADDPQRMLPTQTHILPAFIRRVAYTSFAIVSETGAALLIDCGQELVIETLQQWQSDGEITSVDGCWITHYHDDHVDALPQLREIIGCSMITHAHLVDLITHPRRYFLPCISPASVLIDQVKQDGDSWQWHEFTLTAFHFPAQTLYHNALLVEGHGKRALIAGDAAAPTGIDDYCAGNRNLLGAGRGYRYCVDLWRQLNPDYILNAHQDLAFSFTEAELNYMETMLIERERLFAKILPWTHPNFGTDEHWARAYPYEQSVSPGQVIEIDMQFTNHGPQPAQATIEPILPAGWLWDETISQSTVRIPAQTDGFTGDFCTNPDQSAKAVIHVAGDAALGQYVIPFRITWDDVYLGQFRHALVRVIGK